ncbi:MAG: ATP-dependent RecD-like DNA helicase [Parachlamydiales bacterium]|jgi:exodeoxyribonuclease V alpha subunit
MQKNSSDPKESDNHRPAKTISGYIENIVFINPENGFTVAKLKEKEKREPTCIVGAIPSIQPGETLLCVGNWKKHPQFGEQFEVINYSVTHPADLIGIQKYLESGLIRGIGPVYAKKIVEKYGLKTLEVIDLEPEKLLKIDGIGKKKIESIRNCWNAQKEIREIIIFLKNYGLSPSFAQKIYRIYGQKSLEKIKKNPYELAKEVQGIGFKTADQIAKKVGFELNSPQRIEAGLEFVLWEMTAHGHTCYKEIEFLAIAEKMLEVEKSLIEKSLGQMIEKKEIIQTLIEKEKFLFLKTLYFLEEGIAKEIQRLQKTPAALRKVKIEPALKWAEERLHLQFAPEQKEGVGKGVFEKLHIITGGPGTGKTTITRAILEITEKLTGRILLAAPTGRAAKRLSQITRKKAFTIHALLEFDFIKKEFKRNPQNPLQAKLLIIDEASMIDTPLMYHLLRAIPSNTRVVFIGDIDQLPSVGPGYVLKDLIASGKISTTRLKTIFRQSRGSAIIFNAHQINQGFFPSLEPQAKSDFLFFEEGEAEKIQEKIISLVKTELPKKYRFDPFEEIQVLCPMKRGVIGSENLNSELQKALNPSSEPFWRFAQRFHLNDKVMQIKNNYEKNVFNGDIGRIFQISQSRQQMIIAFEEKQISYDFSELDEVVLAYAVSVHKYQGSECPCIVMPVHLSHFKLLYRNLLYTAITRGKQLVVLVGTKQAVALAVKNNEVLKRYTGLKAMLLKTMTDFPQVTQNKLF